ncbi:nucleoporin 62 like [Poeciliopsis prolifica]|uniref:nucleoporin 62 like n=1 Tax=Poeciliopsis prolifica TaxID=188132 RepID=UPI002413064C|nr:nucleoporin 62 like [Poeciliopsis prolifica]XP_054888391.1 nucleoporin 62 like [Poeciliopsis prolifica]
MSGGFNFGQPSGFFPAQKTTAAAPAAGFALTNSAPAATGGGFSFGAPTSQTNTNPTGSFSFGNPAKSSAPGTGFSFGTPTNTFGLGTAPQTTAAAPGLTLGSMLAPSTGTGFTLGGGLSSQTTAAAPAGGGFSFGGAVQAPAASAATPAATTAPPAAAAAAGGAPFGGFSFGGSKVLVTTAAASPAPAAPAPTGAGGGFSFGTTAPSTSVAATTQSGGGGFSFGVKQSSTPAPPAYTQAASVAPSGPSLFASPLTTATAAPAATTGFLLGTAPASIASTATPSATGGGLNFTLKPLGSAATTAAASTTTAPAATTGTGFSLGVKPLSSTAMTATTTAATLTTTTTATTANPPVMSYAQLESLINKWSLELEDQERHFLQQATQVNAWDRMLVENGEKITSLHKELEKVKLDQRRLNQELDFILSQQKELEDLLCPLEESVKEQSGTIYMQNADEERERTYKLAENVDAQLKRMSQDLKEIIEHLNTSSGPADTSDPLQQICKILNAHMDSLQWIDQNSVLLQRRVEEVSKLCDTQRKEQEKTFRLTFD